MYQVGQLASFFPSKFGCWDGCGPRVYKQNRETYMRELNFPIQSLYASSRGGEIY